MGQIPGGQSTGGQSTGGKPDRLIGGQIDSSADSARMDRRFEGLYEPRRSSRTWRPSAAMIEAVESGVSEFFDKGDSALGLKRKPTPKRHSARELAESPAVSVCIKVESRVADVTKGSEIIAKRSKMEGEEHPCCICGYEAHPGESVVLKCCCCKRFYHKDCLPATGSGLRSKEEEKSPEWLCSGCPTLDLRHLVSHSMAMLSFCPQGGCVVGRCLGWLCDCHSVVIQAVIAVIV